MATAIGASNNGLAYISSAGVLTKLPQTGAADDDVTWSLGSLVIKLGDAGGADDFIVQDSGGVAMFSLDSDGAITSVVSMVASGSVQGGTITDGTASLTGGNLSSVGTIGSGAITSTGTSGFGAVDVGGGYGSTGVSLSAAGVVQMNGALTVDGASTLTGTVTVAGDLAIASGSITSASGAISFGNENLSTTGTLAAGATTITGALKSNADDGGALGASGTGWSDLFLASAGVINWGAGNATLTHSAGALAFSGNFTVDGNLTVSGDTVTVNTSTLSVEDPLIYMANGNNTSNLVDIGFYGLYDATGSQDVYAGLFRDATDAVWKLFELNQEAPTTTVNTAGTGYAAAALTVGAFNASTGVFSSTVTGATGSAFGDLTLANGSITDSSGAISFGNENLSTTGTLASGALTVTGAASCTTTMDVGGALTVGAANDMVIDAGSITSVSGAISFSNENLSTTGTLASGALTVTGAASCTTTMDVGGALTVGAANDMVIDAGSITSVSGAISFGDENLSTTGTLASGALTVTGAASCTTTMDVGGALTVGAANDMVIDAGSITSVSGAISFGDENLSTTGTLGSGAFTGGSTGSFSGALTLSNADSALVISGNGTVNQSGTGQVDFGGNVDANAGLDVSGDALTLSGALSASAGHGFAFAAAPATHTDSSTAGSGTATAYSALSYSVPTLAATNASVTTTDAATIYIAGAPAAGTNQTITNAMALWVDAGNVRLDGGLRFGTAGVSVTDILDEDAMGSDSATALATQQSIKAYVDSSVGAANQLNFSGDSGGTLTIELASEELTLSGGTGITSTGSVNDISFATDANQSHVTTVGALGGGSISSGFGNIDIGASTLGAGASTLASLSVDGATDLDQLTVTTTDGTALFDGTGKVQITASAGLDVDVASNFSALATFTSGIVLEDSQPVSFGTGAGDGSMSSDGTNVLIAADADLDLSSISAEIYANRSAPVDSVGYADGDILVVDSTGDLAKADASDDDFVLGVAVALGTADAAGQKWASFPGQIVKVSTDISALAKGAIVYLSETAGAVTGTAPQTAGSRIIRVGQVWDNGTTAGDGYIVWQPQFIAKN